MIFVPTEWARVCHRWCKWKIEEKKKTSNIRCVSDDRNLHVSLWILIALTRPNHQMTKLGANVKVWILLRLFIYNFVAGHKHRQEQHTFLDNRIWWQIDEMLVYDCSNICTLLLTAAYKCDDWQTQRTRRTYYNVPLGSHSQWSQPQQIKHTHLACASIRKSRGRGERERERKMPINLLMNCYLQLLLTIH